MLRSINHKVISIIPKVKQVSIMKHYRPISLCNVLYKIVSKVLTHRLQPFMHCLVSEEQNAFTKGRLILNNIIIRHEVMHHLKLRKKNKNYEMALKLDINKAY